MSRPAAPGDRDLSDLREEYARGGLEESDAPADPLELFGRWYDEASAAGVHEPNAMVVATVDPDGAPSGRFVLLKGFGPDGFRFFTNTASRKGRGLAAEPRCALLFPWHPLERQIRVDGRAEPLSSDDVAAYFDRRPRGSRLGAWASPQSRAVGSREELSAAYDDVQARFADTEQVPVPPEWGGYLVVPETIEFWQDDPGGCTTGWSIAASDPAGNWGGWRPDRCLVPCSGPWPDRWPGLRSGRSLRRAADSTADSAAENPLSDVVGPIYGRRTRERRWSEA